MLYHDFLKDLTKCPFCDAKDRVLAAKQTAYLTYARAPYHPHHLLVIPTRHIVSFFDITKEEMDDINELLKIGATVLKKLNYDNFTILVRDGEASGKSVPHVHYHLVPNDPIGDLNHLGEPRVVLSDEEIEKLSTEVVSLINS